MVRAIKKLFRNVALVFACCTIAITALGTWKIEILEIIGGAMLIGGLAMIGWMLQGIP
jgi:hypothetical protein